MELTYKDIVIEQLSYRIAELEGYVKQLLQENQQLKNNTEANTEK